MLTDIVTNIFNNIINYITGQNAQDRFVNLLDSTPNILSDANQASGYPATDINNEIVSTYYNENDSRANIITKQGLGELVGSKFYQINDADGSTRTLQVCAENAFILHNFAIDVQTGETGDYDINTDVFTPIVVSGTPTLSQVLTAGNTSGANDIEFDATQGLLFANTSRLREGTIDAGLGGAKGVAQICGLGYELKWEAGRLYVMDGNGTGIRQSLYNFANIPTVTDDNTKGYSGGSLWTLDDGTVYTCLNPATGAAIWVQVSNSPTLQQVTDAGATTTVGVTVDNGAGESIDIKHDLININNALGTATITSPTLTTATTFELPNKATSPQTFAMLSDIGTPNLQQVTDAGFTTTNGIKVDDGVGNYVQVNSSNILMEDSSGNALSVYPDSMTIQNPSFGAGTIKATTLANNVFFELPNKAAGTETFAMLSDITAGGVASVSSGTNISVDNTDPANPIINSLADRYSTTSVTSNTISNGAKTFTVDADLAYIPLQEVLIVYDPSNHMHATVTSYSGTTLVVDVKTHTGSGTYTSWVLNLDGVPVDAITGAGTANEIAYFTAGQVIASLAVATYPSLTELSYVKGVTSAIQTQLNAIKKPISSVGNGTTVTGVVVNTYSKGLLIPANSRVANDVVQIDFQVAKTGAAGNIQLRFYWNTTNDLSGSPILLGTSPNGAALWLAFSRLLSIEVANGTGNATKVAPTSVVTLATGYGTSTTATSTVAIDWTANGYLICAILNSNAADSSVCNMLKLL